MKKVLAIGNSFSEDALKYLHQILQASGEESKIVNLFIGGCSLERHWRNIETGETAYQYQLNGTLTERYVSIEEVLKEENWDYIVTQQASHDSGWADTYEPFMGLIVDYLRHMAPNAEVFLHETWAYETTSTHSNFMRYHRTQSEMYEKLHKCYWDMAEKYGLRVIPSGDIIQYVRTREPFVVQSGGISLCRDGFHMSFLYGRYLLACVWAKTLFDTDILNNSFIPESVAVRESADLEIIERICRLVAGYEIKTCG